MSTTSPDQKPKTVGQTPESTREAVHSLIGQLDERQQPTIVFRPNASWSERIAWIGTGVGLTFIGGWVANRLGY